MFLVTGMFKEDVAMIHIHVIWYPLKLRLIELNRMEKAY